MRRRPDAGDVYSGRERRTGFDHTALSQQWNMERLR